MKYLLMAFLIIVTLQGSGLSKESAAMPKLKGITVAEYYEQHCAECHGVNAKAHALGKSYAIYSWSAKRVEDALSGYKLNTYGRSMKNVMQSQVALLSFKDIKILARYIAQLKADDKQNR